MKITPLAIPEVLLIEPEVFSDNRGYFFESFNQRVFEAAIGRPIAFVQDNQSRSAKGVLRGLHYQIMQPQGKLIQTIAGEVFDVAVDMRRGSANFGKWVGAKLTSENRRQLWIPEGFAHGFAVLSESADVLYKTTDYWAREHERCILWNDPEVGIRWPMDGDPILSSKDTRAVPLSAAETFA
jgi:dTDP-4-dehydrorhamnose 3,5-epimerase